MRWNMWLVPKIIHYIQWLKNEIESRNEQKYRPLTHPGRYTKDLSFEFIQFSCFHFLEYQALTWRALSLKTRDVCAEFQKCRLILFVHYRRKHWISFTALKPNKISIFFRRISDMCYSKTYQFLKPPDVKICRKWLK